MSDVITQYQGSDGNTRANANAKIAQANAELALEIAHRQNTQNPHGTTAAQVGAVAFLGNITDTNILNNPAYGLSYEGICQGTAIGLQTGTGLVKFYRNYYIDGWGAQEFMPINSSVKWRRTSNGTTYNAWVNAADGGHAYSADYASGLSPETAACAVNERVLPYRTSTIPTGANGIIVWRLDVSAP